MEYGTWFKSTRLKAEKITQLMVFAGVDLEREEDPTGQQERKIQYVCYNTSLLKRFFYIHIWNTRTQRNNDSKDLINTIISLMLIVILFRYWIQEAMPFLFFFASIFFEHGLLYNQIKACPCKSSKEKRWKRIGLREQSKLGMRLL